jgi:hypothetical protein
MSFIPTDMFSGTVNLSIGSSSLEMTGTPMLAATRACLIYQTETCMDKGVPGMVCLCSAIHRMKSVTRGLRTLGPINPFTASTNWIVTATHSSNQQS